MRSMLHRFVAAARLGAVLLVSACATEAPPLEAGATGPYRLGPGDIVQLGVFGDPTISGNYRLDDTGRISVPLAGAVELSGRTLREGEAVIAQRMRAEGVLTDPRISLNIDQYRNVYVMGEVGRSGAYEFQPGLTAVQAIALAGGFTVRANRDNILVSRPGVGDGAARRARADTPLQAGDVVTIPERWF